MLLTVCGKHCLLTCLKVINHAPQDCVKNVPYVCVMYSIETTRCTYSSQCCLCSVNRIIWRNVLQLLIVFGQRQKYSEWTQNMLRCNKGSIFFDKRPGGKVAFDLQFWNIQLIIYWCMWKLTCRYFCVETACHRAFWIVLYRRWAVLSLFQHHSPPDMLGM